MTSVVENINIISPATTSFSDAAKDPGTQYTITLKATDKKDAPIKNKKISIDMTALQMPLYYGGRTELSKVITFTSDPSTDANGEIKV